MNRGQIREDKRGTRTRSDNVDKCDFCVVSLQGDLKLAGKYGAHREFNRLSFNDKALTFDFEIKI